MRAIAVLRPEPGNAATCRRIAAAGGDAVSLPLFAVRPLPWTPPAVARFDALFLTSANAVRHGGAALATYRDLPVYAVGAATTAAARAAGFAVAAVGNGDARTLAELAGEHGIGAALHLAGRERAHISLAGVAETIAVYASEPIELTAARLALLPGAVVLIHSPRAGERLSAIAPGRDDIRIAAISSAALAAAGSGWADAVVAPRPDDNALIAAALTLAD